MEEGVPLLEHGGDPSAAVVAAAGGGRDGAPRPLLSAIRYGDSVVFQSVKYKEVFVARTDVGGVVSAVTWGDDCAWTGSRLRLRPVASAAEDSPADGSLVCLGDEVSLVTADDHELPVCQCQESGILCAQDLAGVSSWIVPTFRIMLADEDDVGARDTPQVVCSWDEIRLRENRPRSLSSSDGHYLRAASMPAATVDAAGTGGETHTATQHPEAVVTAVHARFGGVCPAAKVIGTPSVHVLCCLPSRDKDREVLRLVVATDEASSAARASAARYRIDGHCLEEDSWVSSAGKVLSIGAGVMGKGAKLALGWDTGGVTLPSWRSKKFCGAVMTLQTSAKNAPMNVAHMRALTDHAIPEFLLSGNSAIEAAVVDGMRAEWHLPSASNMHWSKCQTKLLYLHGGAFCTCNSRTHRDLLHRLSLASQSAILAIDYRRPPEHPCPVAIDDAVRAYRWMLQAGISPADIYLAGDSAGGALAVSTFLALVKFGDPAPAGLVLMSPWVDVSDGRGDDERTPKDGTPNPQRPSFGDNAPTDYITAPLAQLLADAWASGLDLQDPWVSPIFFPDEFLHALPPMLVQVGGAEMLRDQILEFASKVVGAGGGPVDLQVAPEMPHVYQLFAFVNEMPEINGSIANAGSWIRAQADHHTTIPTKGRRAWINAGGVTAADVMPIALHSGWLHRELSSSFRRMKRRFFVLIAEDNDNTIAGSDGAHLDGPSPPELVSAGDPEHVQQLGHTVSSAGGRERLLVVFEDNSATLGCKVRRVILLRHGCFTVGRTKNQRRGFPHCMRLDVDAEDDDLLLPDGTDDVSAGLPMTSVDSESAQSSCLVGNDDDTAESCRNQSVSAGSATAGGESGSFSSSPSPGEKAKSKHVFAAATSEELEAWLDVLVGSGARTTPHGDSDTRADTTAAAVAEAEVDMSSRRQFVGSNTKV
eukprot:COSAG02_NODE_318_length_24799_cov_9.884615_6_plen_930_part_00